MTLGWTLVTTPQARGFGDLLHVGNPADRNGAIFTLTQGIGVHDFDSSNDIFGYNDKEK